MPASDPERPKRRRKHDDDRLGLGNMDELEDPQDPPDPSEASDPETGANAKAAGGDARGSTVARLAAVASWLTVAEILYCIARRCALTCARLTIGDPRRCDNTK